MNIINYRHTGVVAKNIKKSLFFYKNLLNLKLIKKTIENKKIIQKLLNIKISKLTTYKLGYNNSKIIIEILHFNKTNKNEKIFLNTEGITHISLTVKNLNAIYNKLIKNKVKFISEPILSENKKFKLCFCRTPEGCYLELVQVI
jgi:hypothetical protein